MFIELMMVYTSVASVVPTSNARSDTDHGSRRPRTLHVSKSFSRLEPSTSSPLLRTRAGTLQSGSPSKSLNQNKSKISAESKFGAAEEDIFEKPDSDDEAKLEIDNAATSESPMCSSERFSELPIELISLTDRSENAKNLRNNSR